jgi:hypothetical protein
MNWDELHRLAGTVESDVGLASLEGTVSLTESRDSGIVGYLQESSRIDPERIRRMRQLDPEDEEASAERIRYIVRRTGFPPEYAKVLMLISEGQGLTYRQIVEFARYVKQSGTVSLMSDLYRREMREYGTAEATEGVVNELGGVALKEMPDAGEIAARLKGLFALVTGSERESPDACVGDESEPSHDWMLSLKAPAFSCKI